ncbi:hypothetical protein [Anaeromicropila herbilytica]|uniref:Lipoprotein n=1 Tax=Anaeromicropila herbilytica TaxID=2785025 RepID=A0A7R7ID92_9FIRM|nr:hypothetical protein [Anaeromicropila herbilytica]BCN30799.1 hypothetical protein bsdtb5_20940 [Anaeromicropila herbilytica]
MKTLTKILKVIIILCGALVAGATVGCICNIINIPTTTVAIILACSVASCFSYKKKEVLA